MRRAMFLYNVLSDAALLSGGAYVASLPLGNVQSLPISTVARTVDTTSASTKIHVTFNRERAFKAVVLGPLNVTTAYQYRIRSYENPGFGEDDAAYDSGWIKPADGIAAGPLDLEWEDPDFWLAIKPFDDADRGPYLIHLVDGTPVDQYWSIEIDDETNPAGFIDIGRLLMCDSWEASINYEPGTSNGLSFRDNSRGSVALGGARHRAHQINPRVWRAAFPMLDESEVLAQVYRLQLKAGYANEVFVIPDPDDQTNMQQRCIHGNFTQMNPMAQVSFQMAGTGFEVEEIIP